MSDTDAPPAPAPSEGAAVRQFLSAVYEALDTPVAAWVIQRRRYLTLLERRSIVARASIRRLLADPASDALDYASEADHIRLALADMPADSYRCRLAPPVN